MTFLSHFTFCIAYNSSLKQTFPQWCIFYGFKIARCPARQMFTLAEILKWCNSFREEKSYCPKKEALKNCQKIVQLLKVVSGRGRVKKVFQTVTIKIVFFI